MSDRDFCLWLQGFFELTGATEVTEAQTKMIKEHLALVFNKVTPPLGIKITEVPGLTEPFIWPKDPVPFPGLGQPTIIC